jgi:hypothetical protein
MGSPFSMVAVRHSNPAAQSRGNAEKWAKPSRNLPNGAALRYFSAMSSSVRVVLIALFLHAMPVGAVEPAALAIRGYDPVAYFTDQRATPGIAAHEYVWDEHVWRFVSAAHRALFAADPVKYAPQFANFCAVALARGEVREANPEYWLISEGRLYLFGKPHGPDVFRRDMGTQLELANKNRKLLPGAQAPAGRPAE